MDGRRIAEGGEGESGGTRDGRTMDEIKILSGAQIYLLDPTRRALVVPARTDEVLVPPVINREPGGAAPNDAVPQLRRHLAGDARRGSD